MIKVSTEPAICYSGYRAGQNPSLGVYPTYEQVKEDLLILNQHWKQLRLYDSGPHAEVVLEVIQNENLDTTVMLGAAIGAEINNHSCPWGKTYTEAELTANIRTNALEIERLIQLANRYPDIVRYLSAGNEATVDWTDHLVSTDSMVAYVKKVQSQTLQPVTFCENYVPWCTKLEVLAETVDIISLHTYPAWEFKTVDQALEYTKQNYYSVANRYPYKTVAITEAGWATQANDKGIPSSHADQNQQETYCRALTQWTQQENILTFLFEAFDEDWKGSDDPRDPEKHWGLFTIDRKPKLAAALFNYDTA